MYHTITSFSKSRKNDWSIQILWKITLSDQVQLHLYYLADWKSFKSSDELENNKRIVCHAVSQKTQFNMC